MTLLWLAGGLALVAHALASTLLALPAFWLLARPAPERSARAALALRLLPSAAAVGGILLLLLPSFLRNEPAATPERPGRALVLCASLGAALFAAAAARVAVSLLLTHRFVRACAPSARPLALAGFERAVAVDTDFPLVAMVGLRRPRLYVGRSVLRALTPSELRAVAVHEAAHAAGRHNLALLLTRACPDVLALPGLARRAEASVHAAFERAADDAARRRGGEMATDLASSLLKVSRLMAGAAPPPLLASALFDGGSVEQRVRRLLDDAPAPAAAPARLGPYLGAAMLLAPLYPVASHGAYEAAELLARLLT